MKRLIDLFTLMLILLILLPTAVGAASSCGIESSCCEESSIPSETPNDDNCLSFCLCNCCGTTVFFDFKKEVKIQQPFSILFSSLFIFQTPVGVSCPTDIWQPPKSV